MYRLMCGTSQIKLVHHGRSCRPRPPPGGINRAPRLPLLDNHGVDNIPEVVDACDAAGLQDRGRPVTESPPRYHHRDDRGPRRQLGYSWAQPRLTSATSTRASLKHAPPARSFSVSGAKVLAVSPPATSDRHSPFGIDADPRPQVGVDVSDDLDVSRAAVPHPHRSPSVTRRAARRRDGAARTARRALNSPNIELMVRVRRRRDEGQRQGRVEPARSSRHPGTHAVRWRPSLATSAPAASGGRADVSRNCTAGAGAWSTSTSPGSGRRAPPSPPHAHR